MLKGLEQRLGREPDGHLRPRPLDLDILLFGERCGADARLTLPHPRLAERGFVLAPLAELAPDLVLPDSGETIASAWARLQRRPGRAVAAAVARGLPGTGGARGGRGGLACCPGGTLSLRV